ncbi:MAG: hypothetical protein LBE76_02685 [Nitrososphaerota archaeon]|jgi:N-acetylneuraminic acid mutarotase|nr:hypothetical protein [Nitrososphaerota archaeon]
MSKCISLVLIFFFISGSFAATINPVSASGLVEDSWNTKKPLPQARANLGVVAVEHKIYAIGGYTAINYEWGYNQDGFVGDNERYDPKTNRWTTLKPMPTPRANFAIFTYENKIYCVGGEFLNGPGTYKRYSLIEVYDIATNRWSIKKDAPFEVLGSQAYVVDGQIFLRTGGDMYLYDPATDSWVRKTSMPRPDDIPEGNGLFDTVSVALDNKIMVYSKYGTTNEFIPPFPVKVKIMVYDVKIDEWSEGKAPPEEYDSRLVVGSCISTGTYTAQKAYFLLLTLMGTGVTPIVYDPVKDVWSTAKDISTGRIGFGATVVNDLLYVIGGRIHGAEVVSLNEQYVPIDYISGSMNSDFSKPLNQFVVVVLVLTVGIVTVKLFLYFKKKQC